MLFWSLEGREGFFENSQRIINKQMSIWTEDVKASKGPYHPWNVSQHQQIKIAEIMTDVGVSSQSYGDDLKQVL